MKESLPLIAGLTWGISRRFWNRPAWAPHHLLTANLAWRFRAGRPSRKEFFARQLVATDRADAGAGDSAHATSFTRIVVVLSLIRHALKPSRCRPTRSLSVCRFLTFSSCRPSSMGEHEAAQALHRRTDLRRNGADARGPPSGFHAQGRSGKIWRYSSKYRARPGPPNRRCRSILIPALFIAN